MIFQEPTTSLNPCFTIGFQLAETLRLHLDMDRKAARKRSIELLELVGIPAPDEPPRRLSAPDVGRHEPARDDRDGHRLQSAPADRRRADHRARRDDPGADPRPAARPAAGARHGAGARHAQHGRGRRDGAARRRDVRGPGDGRSARPTRCSPRRSIRTPTRCWRRCRSATTAATGWRRSPASCPGLHDRPAGCLFAPRCRYATPALQRAAGAAAVAGRPRALPLSARRSRSARRTARAMRTLAASAAALVARRCSQADDVRHQPSVVEATRPAPRLRRSAAGCSDARASAGRRRRLLRHRRGPHARRRRRIGLRQVDARARRRADRAAVGGRRSTLGGVDAVHVKPAHAAQAAQDRADGVPESLRLAQPAQEDRRDPRSAARRSTPTLAPRSARRARARDAR